MTATVRCFNSDLIHVCFKGDNVRALRIVPHPPAELSEA